MLSICIVDHLNTGETFKYRCFFYVLELMTLTYHHAGHVQLPACLATTSIKPTNVASTSGRVFIPPMSPSMHCLHGALNPVTWHDGVRGDQRHQMKLVDA